MTARSELARERKGPGAKVPGNEKAREQMGPGAKFPGSERARERKFQGVNWPGFYWPIRSGERKGCESLRIWLELCRYGAYTPMH